MISAPSAMQAGSAQLVAREGQEFSLQCTSSGGNPEPNITWFRNDQLLVAQQQAGAGQGLRIEQSRHITNSSNPAAGSTTTSSLLTWMPSIEDHQATYKCQVSNKAMAKQAPFERELTLAVECKYEALLISTSVRAFSESE